MEDAEKLWYFIKTRDVEEVVNLLYGKKTVDVKQICELEVNKIVWPREQNHRDGFSCLHYAAKKGRHQIFEEMFHYQGEDKNALDINLPSSVLGWSPLHYTAYGGNIQAMKVLLKQGALVNFQGRDGKTPLHIAIDRGMKKAMVALVNSGADVNVGDIRGLTPLHYCTGSVDNAENKTSIMQDRLEMIEFLLTRSSKAGVQDQDGNLPLHLALQSNSSVAIVKILCTALSKPIKDSINTKNHDGLAPVHHCRNSQQLQILLSFGANVNLPAEQDSQTILHMSTTNLDMVTFLLKNGADQLSKEKHGRIPLHLAVAQECPNFECVQKLASDYGCCIARDIQGNTALHLLCKNDYKKLVVESDGSEMVYTVNRGQDPLLEMMIEETGSDTDALNDMKETPLHICLRKRLLHKADILIAHGADIDAFDQNNLTPRMINPSWARRVRNSMDLSDTGSEFTTTTGRRSRRNSIALTESDLTNNAFLKSSLKKSSSKDRKEVRMPEWVKEDANGKRAKRPWAPVHFAENKKNSEKLLTRELTELHSEVDDVKNFLEEFSREGREVKTVRLQNTNNSSSGTSGGQMKKGVRAPQKLTRELTKLQDEVHDLNKMLQEVAG